MVRQPVVPVFPESREFLRHGTFSVKTKKVPGNLGKLFTVGDFLPVSNALTAMNTSYQLFIPLGSHFLRLVRIYLFQNMKLRLCGSGSKPFASRYKSFGRLRSHVEQ